MDGLREHPRVGNFWPRWHLKTTILTIGLAVQEILRNPDITILICHAVDEEVEKMISEIVNHFRANERLRALRPEIMPARNAVRWFKTNQLTVRREKFSRQPTVLGRGAGAEITGAHVDLILLDDIIGRRTIEDSALPKIASWYRNTVVPVLNPGGRIRVVGTRWHTDDIYGTFLDSRDWDCMVRAALETDSQPDYKGSPVLYGPPGGQPAALKRMELLRADMGPDFSPQMMNDPSPAGEKPWDASRCEHYVSMKEMVRYGGPAVRFVLSDPAPAKVGSFDDDRKKRLDGSKDFWATAVVEIRTHESRQEIILLDGVHSRDWGRDEGFEQICRLMKKWATPYVALESTGQAIALYEDDLRQSARKVGTPYTFVKLANTYKGKNVQFRGLADKALRDEFLICETVPPDFLRTFLDQAREWRPLSSGRNSLKYDDVANCVSFSVDPALQEYAPQPMLRDPFDALDEELEGSVAYSRYCGV
jgi:hypothetical protein